MDDKDRRWRDFYDRWAPRYDLTIGLWALLSGFSDNAERRKMVDRLQLWPGARVLEVSVGTGSNLPFVAEATGPGGRLVGLDLSTGMLRQCQRKTRRLGLRADLIEGEGARVPFGDATFDGVLHFGGINEFGDKRAAIDEMLRVAKPGARIVIGDEGLRPETRLSLRKRLLLRINKLYTHRPPLDLLPPDAKELRVDYFRGDFCYLIDFTKP